jgi:hypothetical protein
MPERVAHAASCFMRGLPEQPGRGSADMGDATPSDCCWLLSRCPLQAQLNSRIGSGYDGPLPDFVAGKRPLNPRFMEAAARH